MKAMSGRVKKIWDGRRRKKVKYFRPFEIFEHACECSGRFIVGDLNSLILAY